MEALKVVNEMGAERNIKNLRIQIKHVIIIQENLYSTI